MSANDARPLEERLGDELTIREELNATVRRATVGGDWYEKYAALELVAAERIATLDRFAECLQRRLAESLAPQEQPQEGEPDGGVEYARSIPVPPLDRERVRRDVAFALEVIEFAARPGETGIIGTDTWLGAVAGLRDAIRALTGEVAAPRDTLERDGGGGAMNRTEHLLTIGMEECAEIAKDMAKCLRFGPGDVNPADPDGPDNAERIVREFYDLQAVVEMLIDEGVLPREVPGQRPNALIMAKRAKVERMFAYSAKCGTLDAPSTPEGEAP